jgi:hypothetical protein
VRLFAKAYHMHKRKYRPDWRRSRRSFRQLPEDEVAIAS